MTHTLEKFLEWSRDTDQRWRDTQIEFKLLFYYGLLFAVNPRSFSCLSPFVLFAMLLSLPSFPHPASYHHLDSRPHVTLPHETVKRNLDHNKVPHTPLTSLGPSKIIQIGKILSFWKWPRTLATLPISGRFPAKSSHAPWVLGGS